MVGMVTIDDIHKLDSEARGRTLVSDIMTPSQKLAVVTPEADVAEAFSRLESEDLRELPVVNQNKVVGLLHRKDIVRWLQWQ
jgi:CBS domain-containing protein